MTVEVVATARRHGNSIGVTLPKSVVESERIKPNDKVIVSVRRARSMAELFGSLKRKISAQEAKDELRKGWD